MAQHAQEAIPDAAGFTVHLVPESRKDEELVRPAGQDVALEGKEERYRLWLEAPGFISPRQWILVDQEEMVAEGPVKVVRVPVTKAAQVRLAILPEPGVALRLLHLGSGFVRRVLGERLRATIQVPPGVVVGALYHNDRQQYLAVTKPVHVTAGSLATLFPKPPDPPFSDLMVVLIPAERSPNLVETGVALRTPEGVTLRPAACGGDDSALYCFWYGLKARWGMVEVSNDELFAPTTEVALAVGQLTVAAIPTALPPSLRVVLRLPPELAGERKVEVLVGDRLMRSETVPPQQTEVPFPRVPAKPLTVRLTVGDWGFVEHVEPRPGQESTAVFEPPVFLVHGTVFVGDTPTPATIRFFTGVPQKWVEVQTDAKGQYETTLFAASPFAQVAAKGIPQPVLMRVDTPYRPDTLLDFHLPGKVLEVTVQAARSPARLAEAEVAVLGATVQEGGPVFRLQGKTDEQGQVRLGPLSGEKVSVVAKARGYREQEREVSLVPEGVTKLLLQLEPESDTKLVRAMTPLGHPAAGFQAFLLPSAMAEVVAWSGGPDKKGNLRVPADLCCLLALTHEQGGLTTIPWPAEEDETTVVLRPRAAPLTLRAQHANGAPVPFARLRIWIDGQPVGPALAYRALGAHLYFDHQGFWRAFGLPAAPLEVVSWEAEVAEQGRAGAFDSQRQTIPYPWPPEVVLQPYR